MTQHTPGPWIREGRFVYALGKCRTNVFSVNVQSGGNGSDAATSVELEANARLIVAAPKLLEALRVGLAWSDADGLSDEDGLVDTGERRFRGLARAAIARATPDQTCEVCGHGENTVGPLSANEKHNRICDDCLTDNQG